MSNIQPYIILNGTDSRSISGLLISSLPPISKPQVRTQIETVDGRDGDIVTPLGFSAYDKVINIGLTYNYDVDEIIEFFNSEGIVTFSNEPDKYYRYSIYEQIDFEKLIRFKTAEVTLHVQPFKFSTTEEPELFDVVSGQAIAVTNEGNTDARPNLTIIGSGDIDVSLNGSQILSIELEDDQAVIIDSEDMNAYAAQSAIREVEADIEPELDTNGYGSVWIGGAGKNKAHVTAASQTINGVSYTVNPDGTIKANGTATSAAILDCGQITLSAGNSYILSGCASGGSGLTYCLFLRGSGSFTQKLDFGSGVSFTVDETITTTLSIIVYSGSTVNNLEFKPMIRLSDTSSDFEPYENIGEISGSTELEVVDCGVNLGNFQNGYGIDASGNIVAQNNRVSTVTPIIINPSLSYYVKGDNVSNKRFIYAVFKDNTLIRRIANIRSGTLLDTTNGNKLFVCLYDNATVETDKPMVVFDNAITTYAAYQGSTNTIAFEQDGEPLTVYGGYLNVTTGELTVTRNIVDLGTLNWAKISMGGGRYGFRANIPTMAITPASNLKINAICECFEIKSGNDVYLGNVGLAGWGVGTHDIAVYDNTHESGSAVDFQNAMTGVMLVYELATPTEIQLTPTQINNLLGLNNMYTDNSGDLTVKHKSNGVIVTDTGAVVSFYAGLDDIEKGVLLNRAITGDYDKIRLRKGVNTFVLTGNARQFAIDKFSRWI